MLAQAEELYQLGENSVIKVPTGGYRSVGKGMDEFTGLKVIRKLWEKGIPTNATLIFNSNQAFWAAQAGATYVSPFMGRLADYAYANDLPERKPGNSLYYVEDPKDTERDDQPMCNTEYVASGGKVKDAGARLIFEIANIFANYRITTEILAASFRNEVQVTECLLAGADILTVPTKILEKVASHPLSDMGMNAFLEDLSDERRTQKEVSRYMKQLIRLGMLRQVRKREDKYLVERVIKSRITSDVLRDIKEKLMQYASGELQ